MIPALRVAAENWESWLKYAASTRHVRNLELPGALLDQTPGVKAKAATYELHTVHVYDAISPQITRYLTEKSAAFQEQVCNRCIEQLKSLTEIGVNSVDFDLGLNRIDDCKDDNAIAARVNILQDLLIGLTEYPVNFVIPVRYPTAHPASKEWEKAANIVHDVMQPSCRIGVDVFPGELAADVDLEGVVRWLYYSIDFIRFHYEPRLGDDLQTWKADEWIRLLRAHGFRRKIIFCPKVNAEREIAETLQSLDKLFDQN